MRRAVAIAVLLFTGTAHAQKVEELDPHVRATVTSNTIKLTWDAVPDVTSWSVKKREGATWTTLEAALPAATTTYEDKTVTAGKTVEYSVQRKGATTSGSAYVLAGIDVPFPDDLGVVALVVDDVTAKITTTLEDDLAREGWDVEKLIVAATDKPAAVKDKLKALRDKHGARFTTAFLLGTVPRAFSGLLNPDGHPDHKGAWPADGYYADLDGMWPDTAELGGEGAFINKAGDGKFDPSRFPSELELAVGRVDFFEMPAFAPLDEQGLLKRYLDADHAFRSAQKTYGARTFVSDNFGYFSGEAFARIAWRDSYSIYGSGPESGKPIFDTLEDPAGYSLAFGCGGGSPTGASGVGSTADFVKRSPRAVFFGLFGSYFGDWSYKDNFLRAALGSAGGVLATAWFARPWHHIHHLAAMKTFGESMRATMNNNGTEYDTGTASRSVHMALLGDPTLRLFVARAPATLKFAQHKQGIELQWGASTDADSGYVVYRREDGPWQKIADATDTLYLDTSVTRATVYRYRVVAKKKQVTASGSFYLHSPGEIVDASWNYLGDFEDGSPPTNGSDAGLEATSEEAESGCACRTHPVATGVSPWLMAIALTYSLRGRRSASRR
jgi:hypothetical protein